MTRRTRPWNPLAELARLLDALEGELLAATDVEVASSTTTVDAVIEEALGDGTGIPGRAWPMRMRPEAHKPS